MTPESILIKRTGMSQADAEYYASLAEARIRQYLGLASDADISMYAFQIVDIACLLWQQDIATRNGSATLGYESRSFSEGGVSESVAGATGQAIWESYSRAVDDVLATLDNNKMGVVRFI